LSLICVSGATSRAGKTALLSSIVRQLLPRGASAVKFTTTDDVFERCPRGTPCVVCDIDVPYRIVSESHVLRQPGTDTDRMARAGARRVLWAIAKRAAVEQAWARVVSLLEPGLQLMEGSTIVPFARPQLSLFVVHPFLDPARWKESSAALLARADFVLVNRPAGEARAPASAVLEAIRARRVADDVIVGDVTRPLAEWAPRLAAELGAF
jgi:molybdopterin-guanine dinucleotide biosynthesis protein